MSPGLTVRMTKHRDARALLVLVREDDTTTSGGIGAPGGTGGPVHDLAHVVVESALELSDGHLGLVAAGWELADFDAHGTRAPLPAEALLADAMAGRLSTEEMLQQFSSASDFDASLRAQLVERAPGYDLPVIPEEILTAMRVELADLRRQWELLAPGDALELRFVPRRRASVSRPARTSGSGPSAGGRERARD